MTIALYDKGPSCTKNQIIVQCTQYSYSLRSCKDLVSTQQQQPYSLICTDALSLTFNRVRPRRRQVEQEREREGEREIERARDARASERGVDCEAKRRGPFHGCLNTASKRGRSVGRTVGRRRGGEAAVQNRDHKIHFLQSFTAAKICPVHLLVLGACSSLFPTGSSNGVSLKWVISGLVADSQSGVATILYFFSRQARAV